MTHLTLKNLTKQYPNTTRPSLDALSLDIASGKLVALLGPSGCGKTTTMKLIAGLLEPTRGDILFDGESVVTVPAEKRAAVMVFQNYLLFPYMSVAENVGFGLKMAGIDKATIQRRVGEMLELVKLPGMEQRSPSQLSGGQQQRVALARALITQPRVLLLDEPLSNLDAHLRDEMRELIRSIQRDMAITTVFVTHDQQEAVLLADEIALLFDGVLQQLDAPRAFYERPKTEAIARFFGGQNFIHGEMVDGVFESEIGRFRPHASNVASGQGVLTIRPEAIEIVVNPDLPNTVSGTVTQHTFVGTHTRLIVQVGSQTLALTTAPLAHAALTTGAVINLCLPAHSIHIVPA